MKLLLIDEAAWVTDEVLAAVRPMLSVSHGRMLAMSTPFGRRGWFWQASKSREWRVTTVRADQCPRITPEFLEAERSALGDWRFRSEYGCEFTDLAGRMFSSEDIRAIFAPGQLGAIPAGALFSGLAPETGQPRLVDALVPCRSSGDGHHRFRDGQCQACGADQPLLAATGVIDVALTLGVDIGQQTDPTALVLVETYRPEPTHPKDWSEQRHRVSWVERVPLGTLYGAVVERIAVVAETAQTRGSVMIVLDGTGVGRPVVDLLRKRTSVPLRAVIFTGGETETRDGPYTWHAPKRDLVTALEVVLQSRRLEVRPDCPLQPDLEAELSAFDFSINARGRESYEAASGTHDDLVLALALAIWWAERRGQGAAFAEMWAQRALERGRR